LLCGSFTSLAVGGLRERPPKAAVERKMCLKPGESIAGVDAALGLALLQKAFSQITKYPTKFHYSIKKHCNRAVRFEKISLYGRA
jgi:hypothetical protein